ncbi:MAG TPA: cation:proton antiporter [Rhabdaerophilum sp.]|nr:cation:proton antiporter [Rhabdaerophilum sp.]
MATEVNIYAYSDALVVLGTAAVVVPLVRRWGISPVLGYLGAGAILGPLGLGSFVREVPALFWLTVTDARNVAAIAELGIVFLLFLIGLELSYSRLVTMRRLVFGLGMAQVLASTILIAGLARLAGQGPSSAIVIGSALALSSTAIVIEILSSQGRMRTSSGRAVFSVLLAQDLAVVPILLLVSVLGGNGQQNLMTSLGIALTQTGIALAGIVIFGRLLLRPLFRLVALAQSNELFVAAILFVIVGTGVAAAAAGLSMALGAFVAGLMLSETEYKKAIEGIVEPFKGLLLGIFFFTVGMNIDLREVLRQPLLLLGVVAALMALKAGVMLALGRLFRLPLPATVEASLLLAPGGEFAFVAIGAAVVVKIVPGDVASFLLVVTSLTMVLIPLMGNVARRFDRWVAGRKAPDPETEAKPTITRGHVIVVGHGRVGQVVCAMLARHAIPYIATDHDAMAVSRERKGGADVYFGDATNPAFLQACGVAEASAVIITIHTQSAIDAVVEQVRAIRPDVTIVARARDALHARHLYAIGVTDAVPETIEASLQLSEAALVDIGVPMGLVIASIHEKRDEFRNALQAAAHAAGKTAMRGLKAKET